jgi:hypothetical protein
LRTALLLERGPALLLEWWTTLLAWTHAAAIATSRFRPTGSPGAGRELDRAKLFANARLLRQLN